MARAGASQSAKTAPISTKEESKTPATPEESTASSSKATADESFQVVESSGSTCPPTPEESTISPSNATADEPSQAGESSGSTCPVVLFKPEARLNPDVLELIFRHLNFKELLAVELVGIKAF